MKTKKTLMIAWVIVIIIIIILSLLPQIASSIKHPIDKIMHFFGYFMIGLFPIQLFKLKSKLIIAEIFLVTVAIGTEVLQYYIPSRMASYGDIAANIAGIIVGALVGYALVIVANKHTHKNN